MLPVITLEPLSSASAKTRVLLVDDHELVRRGLALFLNQADDLDVIGQAGCGTDAVRLACQLRPDVILMDLVMPDLDGISAMRAIKANTPDVRVIALTSYGGGELVLQALAAGAAGYLFKDIEAMGLFDAIRAARAGRTTLAPQAAQAIVEHSRDVEPALPKPELTRREREVLVLLVQGLTNSQIAERLVIALPTANFHVSSILNKLGVRSRTSAVAKALQDGIVACRNPG